MNDPLADLCAGGGAGRMYGKSSTVVAGEGQELSVIN